VLRKGLSLRTQAGAHSSSTSCTIDSRLGFWFRQKTVMHGEISIGWPWPTEKEALEEVEVGSCFCLAPVPTIDSHSRAFRYASTWAIYGSKPMTKVTVSAQTNTEGNNPKFEIKRKRFFTPQGLPSPINYQINAPLSELFNIFGG
jgi:hypothetical protein